jgi:hypothetical protein
MYYAVGRVSAAAAANALDALSGARALCVLFSHIHSRRCSLRIQVSEKHRRGKQAATEYVDIPADNENTLTCCEVTCKALATVLKLAHGEYIHVYTVSWQCAWLTN